CRWICLAFLIVAFVVANLNAQVAPPKKGPVPPGKATAPQPKMPVAPVAPGTAKGPSATAAPTARPKGPKVVEPEDISLDTKDNVTVKATFYAGTLKKEAVPFILIHGLDGQRGDMHSLAVYLQSLGHAAIAPDLRGHGQSKSQKLPD